jgi:hypothetical protein
LKENEWDVGGAIEPAAGAILTLRTQLKIWTLGVALREEAF